MLTLALLAALGSVNAVEAGAAEPRPITAADVRQWVRHVAPLPQRIEISGELRLKRARIVVSAQPDERPVFKQAVKELEACLGNGSGDRGEFSIRLELGGPEASALDAVPNRDQAYRILPEAKNTGLRIVARTPVGLLYGVKTLTQLLSVKATADELRVPVLRVDPQPVCLAIRRMISRMTCGLRGPPSVVSFSPRCGAPCVSPINAVTRTGKPLCHKPAPTNLETDCGESDIRKQDA